MTLRAAQEALAAFVAANVTGVDPCHPAVPMKPVARSANVSPADPWITNEDDEGTYCETGQVGLMVDLIAGTVEMAESQAWLADRLDELWTAAAADGVEVLPGVLISPVSATRPQVLQLDGGQAFLIVSVEFDRFPMEAD